MQTIKVFLGRFFDIPQTETKASTKIKYPLKNLKQSGLNIRFSNRHIVSDKYEIKDNEPNMITMSIHYDTKYEIELLFDTNKELIHIKKTKNTSDQEEDQIEYVKTKVELIDTRKYKFFCIDDLT